MSNLIPEKRLDKNGHLITRHVRADKGISSAGTFIPAPMLMSSVPVRKEYKDLERGELVTLAANRASELRVKVPENFWKLLGQVSGSHDNGLSLASQKFYDLLPSMDVRGFQSLSGGSMSWISLSETNGSMAGTAANVFGAAILAYEYSREVDDATLPLPDRIVISESDGIYKTAGSFFEGQKVRCTPEVAADLEAHHLLQAIGLTKDSFPSIGDYYRGLTKLNAKRDEIRPYLPLLIAMNTAYTNIDKSYYFNDEYYLWDNIELVKQYPVERIEAIAREAIKRRQFDEEFAAEVASSQSVALNDGLL